MPNSTIKFKQTELGPIPEDWSLYPLGNLCDIKGGKRLPKGEVLVNYKTDHPYIRITNLTPEGINIDNIQYVTDGNYKKIKNYIIEEGDLYISIVGTIGLVGINPKILDKANLTENAVRLIKFNKLDVRYLMYYLRSPVGQQQIRSNTVGAVQPKLPIYGIKNIKVPVAIKSEQKQIAGILSSLDDKIELNRRMNKTLEAIGQAVFKRWFVDFEFPNEEGQSYKSSGGKMEKSELGLIPSEWKVLTLKDILVLEYGKALKDDQRIEGGVLVYGSSGLVGKHAHELVKGPGIVVGRKGNVGSVFWVNGDFYPIDTTYYVKTNFDLNFVFYMLKMQNFINSDSVVPGLNREQAYQKSVIIPSKKVLDNFGIVLASIRSKILSNEKEADELSQARDLLLPRLMNGKIRV